MDRSFWTMLAISFAKGSLSPVQLQKVLFLLGKELPTEVGTGFYKFSAYNYGPFCHDIYIDASRLATEGLVSINNARRNFNEYSITLLGLEVVQLKKKAVSPKAVAYLDKVVGWAQSLSFSALVRAIYAKYPEYREKSVFQG